MYLAKEEAAPHHRHHLSRPPVSALQLQGEEGSQGMHQARLLHWARPQAKVGPHQASRARRAGPGSYMPMAGTHTVTRPTTKVLPLFRVCLVLNEP